VKIQFGLQGWFTKLLAAKIFGAAKDLSTFIVLLSSVFDLLPVIADSFVITFLQLSATFQVRMIWS
jgi:hypothetical protein